MFNCYNVTVNDNSYPYNLYYIFIYDVTKYGGN